MPATALRTIQLAAQTAWTTAVTTATVKLAGLTDAGLTMMPDNYTPNFIGTLAPAVETAQMAFHGEGNLTQAASYQGICYWLDSLFGAASGSKAANTTYVYNYAAALTAPATRKLYTAQYGYGTTVYSLDGAFVSAMTIRGEAGGLWECDVDLLGRTVSTRAITSGLTAQDVDFVRMSDTKLYIDTWAGTMGSTEAANTLISFELSIDPQAHLKMFAGSAHPGSYGDSVYDARLTLVCEYNAVAKALVDAVKDGLVQRQIRLSATQGTGTTTRLARLNFAGTLVNQPELWGDRDGNMTVSLEWLGTYHSTLKNFFTGKVQNELSALP